MRLAKEAIVLIGWLAITFVAPAAGLLFSISGPGNWYGTLNKPWFNPPDWIFGPVWTCLYVGMAIAAWLVWQKGHEHVLTWPIALFMLQLTLNALWTPLFFGLHRPELALIDIVAMWFAITATTVAFYPVSRLAAILLLPYWLWVSFAVLLNGAIWKLN